MFVKNNKVIKLQYIMCFFMCFTGEKKKGEGDGEAGTGHTTGMGKVIKRKSNNL